MAAPAPHILVIGYGNPGRGDDGLGPYVTGALVRWQELAAVRCEIDYQLAVEHAAMVAEADIVVFVDAATEGPAPFALLPATPESDRTFSSHSVSPGQLLGLARDLFHARPQAWLLAVRGQDFAPFTEVLSPVAQAHADAAIEFLRSWLTQRVTEPAADAVSAPREMPCKTAST